MWDFGDLVCDECGGPAEGMTNDILSVRKIGEKRASLFVDGVPMVWCKEHQKFSHWKYIIDGSIPERQNESS